MPNNLDRTAPKPLEEVPGAPRRRRPAHRRWLFSSCALRGPFLPHTPPTYRLPALGVVPEAVHLGALLVCRRCAGGERERAAQRGDQRGGPRAGGHLAGSVVRGAAAAGGEGQGRGEVRRSRRRAWTHGREGGWAAQQGAGMLPRGSSYLIKLVPLPVSRTPAFRTDFDVLTGPSTYCRVLFALHQQFWIGTTRHSQRSERNPLKCVPGCQGVASKAGPLASLSFRGGRAATAARAPHLPRGGSPLWRAPEAELRVAPRLAARGGGVPCRPPALPSWGHGAVGRRGGVQRRGALAAAACGVQDWRGGAAVRRQAPLREAARGACARERDQPATRVALSPLSEAPVREAQADPAPKPAGARAM